MNILITGATGFIGRNLLPLLANEYKVYCLMKHDTFSLDFEQFLKERNIMIEKVRGDLTVAREVKSAVERVKPEVVIHMAAMTAVRMSWRKWRQFFNVNYVGTMNLVNALTDKNLRLFIHYSTPEILHDCPGEKDEDARVYPATPYAMSKAIAEFYVMSNTKCPTIVVRTANTYDRSCLAGNSEAKGYFVEKAIIGMLTNRVVMFDGHKDRVRSWMHVSDHVDAVRLLIKYGIDKAKSNKTLYHIAPPESAASCGAVFDMIAHIVSEMQGYEGHVVYWGLNPRPYDPVDLSISGRRFISDFPEWRPKSLREGLEVAVTNWSRVLKNASKA